MQELEQYIGYLLPQDYLSFVDYIRQNFGPEPINDLIYIYLEEDQIIERNETFEMKEYLPGYLGIGNDSGGSEIIIRLTETKNKIYYTNHGAYFEDALEIIAESFQDLIERNFSLESLGPKVERAFSSEKLQQIKQVEELTLLHQQLKQIKVQRMNNVLSVKEYLLQKRILEQKIKERIEK